MRGSGPHWIFGGGQACGYVSYARKLTKHRIVHCNYLHRLPLNENHNVSLFFCEHPRNVHFFPFNYLGLYFIGFVRFERLHKRVFALKDWTK